jgi:hypothetical protein
MKAETKKVMKKADPQQSHASKLDQIKTGKKNVRTTGGSEQKKIVITGKDGSKIIQNQTETKTEETAVLRKKRNYVMYEAKLGTETTTDITKIDAPKPKPKTPKPVLRAPAPRIEERIVIQKKRKEYLDNYQYHETKDIKNKNPRFQVIVEHKRLGDIIGGFFEETSYQKQVISQGSNRPKITEKKTTITTSGTANQPKLRGNKSEMTGMKKTTVTTATTSPQKGSATVNKRTTTTTTTKTTQRGAPTTATGGKEKITETTVKRRNEGTGSKTVAKTETKTTTSGTRGGQTETSTTTKTTTKTTAQKPEAAATETKTTQQTSTTTKTTTTTTKTTGGDAGTKTQTETVTKVEQKGESATGGEASSIRKKYAKEKFEVEKQQ